MQRSGGIAWPPTGVILQRKTISDICTRPVRKESRISRKRVRPVLSTDWASCTKRATAQSKIYKKPYGNTDWQVNEDQWRHKQNLVKSTSLVKALKLITRKLSHGIVELPIAVTLIPRRDW